MRNVQSRASRNAYSRPDFSAWLAGALLDRLTHHVQILEIVGDSYRLKASLDQGKDKDKPE